MRLGLESSALQTPAELSLQGGNSHSLCLLLGEAWPEGRMAAGRCVTGSILRQPGQEADLTGLATWGPWEHTQNCSRWKSGLLSHCLRQDVP